MHVLQHCTLHNFTLHNCTLNNCTLHNCTLHNCTLHNCTLLRHCTLNHYIKLQDCLNQTNSVSRHLPLSWSHVQSSEIYKTVFGGYTSTIT